MNLQQHTLLPLNWNFMTPRGADCCGVSEMVTIINCVKGNNANPALYWLEIMIRIGKLVMMIIDLFR